MQQCNLHILLCCALPSALTAQAPRVRDSAGVHIVENGARATAPVAFRLAAKPSFDIGGLKDNPDDELTQRGGYLRSIVLSNGTHVVSDQSKLRFFDASGKQLRVTGQRGAGPREFFEITALCRTRGDTVVVYDASNGRITTFDKSGSILREFPVGHAALLFDGCLEDGTWVLSEPGFNHTAHLIRYNLAGASPGGAGDYWGGKPDMFVVLQPMFLAHGDRIYMGDPRANEVRIFDKTGKLVAIIRTADQAPKTTAAEQAAMVPNMAVSTDDQSILDRFKEHVRTAPHPTEWPAYRRIAVDPDGRMWVEDYQKTEKDRDVWTAFDASGRLLGKFSFPPYSKADDPRIIDFTSGGVEIRRGDSDGAVHLTTYALIPVGLGH